MMVINLEIWQNGKWRITKEWDKAADDDHDEVSRKKISTFSTIKTEKQIISERNRILELCEKCLSSA